MGGWPFAGGRLLRLLGPDYSMRVASRPESGSPAAGSLTVHDQEQEQLIEDAFAEL